LLFMLSPAYFSAPEPHLKNLTEYIGGGTGVRHQTVTRREWLRAGAGNETINTEETQMRHRTGSYSNETSV